VERFIVKSDRHRLIEVSFFVVLVVVVVLHFVVVPVQVRTRRHAPRSNLLVAHRRSRSSADAVRRRCSRCRRRQLEVSPVVRPQQRRTAGMVLSEMRHVLVGSAGHVAALFAHVDLVASLLVSEVELTAVYLATMRLERTALSEGLVTLAAPVWTNTCRHVT